MKRIQAIHIPEDPRQPLRIFTSSGMIERQCTAHQYRRMVALYEAIRYNWTQKRYKTHDRIFGKVIRVRRFDPIFDEPIYNDSRRAA